MIEIFKDKQRFSKEVISKVSDSIGSISYMDAVLELCEHYNLDPSSVGGLLTKPIVEKIETEAKALNLIKRTDSKLDI